MQVYSRAGLVALIFAFAIAFTTAAPITKDASPPSVSVRTINGAGSNVNHVAPVVLAYQKEGALTSGHHRAINLEEENTLVRRKVHISAKVQHAFQKVGHAIKHVAQKVAGGIKTAAKKVGHFIKTTGAQVAKFGLKLIATAQKIASKVVSFIPGVGKLAGKAMEGESAALNAVSDRIHVKLPKRLQKGVNVMNKVRKISGYVPRDLSELDLDSRDDFYDLEEREWEDWEGF